MTGTERRSLAVALRLVEPENGGLPRIGGRAVPYGPASQTLWDWEFGQFIERFDRGAFAESLARGDDVLGRFEHEGGLQLLGRTGNGTVLLEDREDGLYYEIDPPDTSAGRDVVVLVRRGDVWGSSFAFTVPEGGDTWRRVSDLLWERTVHRANLVDVAPVTSPAYLDTSTAVRSLRALHQQEGGQGSTGEGRTRIRHHRHRLELARRR